MKIQPKNWSDFQHYTKRTPPWIKLHRTILDDFIYQRLPIASKALAPMLWLIASESEDGIFDASPDFLAFRLRWSEKDIQSGLKPLIDNGFFEVASGSLAEFVQGATVETEGEADREAETESETSLSRSQNREPDRADDIHHVFEYWQQFMQHPRAKLDDKRRRKIRDRLKDGYEVEDLLTAIEGCAKSPHHMGENKTGTVYDDIELICRDGSHVDKFIKTAHDPDMTRMSTAARQTAKAASHWLSEDNS